MLRSILRSAQIDGHLDVLPLLGVKMPRAYSRRPAVLTLPETFAMIDAAPPDWQCAMATALFTGLRLGELLGLSRDDIDLAQAAAAEAKMRRCQELAEPVVLLLARDPQVRLGSAVPDEAQPVEDSLRAHVVGQRLGLHAVHA